MPYYLQQQMYNKLVFLLQCLWQHEELWFMVLAAAGRAKGFGHCVPIKVDVQC